MIGTSRWGDGANVAISVISELDLSSVRKCLFRNPSGTVVLESPRVGLGVSDTRQVSACIIGKRNSPCTLSDSSQTTAGVVSQLEGREASGFLLDDTPFVVHGGNSLSSKR